VFGLKSQPMHGAGKVLLLTGSRLRESSPVAGTRMGLTAMACCSPPLRTLSSAERFWFPSPDVRLRHQHRRRPLEHGLVLRRSRCSTEPSPLQKVSDARSQTWPASPLSAFGLVKPRSYGL